MEEGQKTKLCPYCRKEILAVAIKCRYCKGDLDDGEVGTQVPSSSSPMTPPIQHIAPGFQDSPTQHATPLRSQKPLAAQPDPVSSINLNKYPIRPLDFWQVLVSGILTLGIYIYAKFYQVGSDYQSISKKESTFSARFWWSIVCCALFVYCLFVDDSYLAYVVTDRFFVPFFAVLSILNVYLFREFINLYEDIVTTHELDIQVQEKKTFLVLGCISFLPIIGYITIGLFLARLIKLNNQLGVALNQTNSEDVPRNPTNPSVQIPNSDLSSKESPRGDDRSESPQIGSSHNRILIPKVFAVLALIVGVLGLIGSVAYQEIIEDESRRINSEIQKYHQNLSDGTDGNFLGSLEIVRVALEAFNRLEGTIDIIVNTANQSLFVKELLFLSLIFVVWGLWNRSWWSRRVILIWSAFAGCSFVFDIYNTSLIMNAVDAFENYARNIVFGNGSENLPEFMEKLLLEFEVKFRHALQTRINDPVIDALTKFLYKELVLFAWFPLLYVIVFCRPSGKKYFRVRSLPPTKRH